MPNAILYSPHDGAAQPSATQPAAAHYSARALEAMAAALAHEQRVARTLGDDGNSHYVLVNRTQSAVPEQHARWMDVMTVQGGSAIMVTGGRIDGATETSPGEESGGAIVGGESRPLGAGDLLVIPAGVPHQILLEAGESIQYITVKVPHGR